ITLVEQLVTADDVGLFDVVVLATGAPQREPDLEIDPGATTASPATVRPEEIGSSTVVVGGGFQGCESALRIARDLPGATVTLVEQHDALLEGDEVFTDSMALPRLLSEAGVDVRTGTRVTAVTTDGVVMDGGDRI